MMNKTNVGGQRRDFRKTSVLLAGGAMLSSAPFMGAHASVDDTIKVVVVGCGGRGTGAAFDAIASGANIKIVPWLMHSEIGWVRHTLAIGEMKPAKL